MGPAPKGRGFEHWRGENSPRVSGGMNGRSGRIRTCDPRVPNAVLYQTEPHSDLRAVLIGKDFRPCKEPIFIHARRRGDVASGKLLRYLHRLARGRPSAPFLLGNGVM